jgi:putative transposase
MFRITLSPDQRRALTSLRQDPSLAPAERDRVEMLGLSADAGWSPPQIARHLGYCPATVRRVFRVFPSVGLAVVHHQRKGPPPATDRRAAVETALRTLLGQDRTWTARQLAVALADHGITLSTRQTRRYLAGLKAGYRRTVRTLAHQQDAARVALAKAELAVLKKMPKQAS